MNIQLSIGMPINPRTAPVHEGRVKPDGIDLIPTPIPTAELFWRQLHFGDFDVSEMSFSSLIIAMARGDDRWTGIPVFTTRRFFHTGLMVRRDSGIEKPEDLKGRRIGVPEYQQTAALWNRGVLQHEFGVAPSDMEFWMERSPELSHGGATGFEPPAGVTVNRIPPEKSLGTMMLSGELEAVMHYNLNPNLINRSTTDLANHPDIKTLFPDPVAEGVRYYRKTGIFPINHGMVIKREIAEKHPWAVLNIFKAFEAANAIVEAQRMEHVDYHLKAGLLPPEAADALRTQVLHHGIAANRKTLETAAQYSHEQGLTPRLMTLDEVFAASTMEQ